MENRNVKQWLEYAFNDLETAEHLFVTKRPVVHPIFLCHESFEKYLKALILFQGKDFPYIHDLERLIDCIVIEKGDRITLANAAIVLKALYPQARYPGVIVLTRKNAEEALKRSKMAQKIILKYLKP